MKKIIILSLLFISGCVGASYSEFTSKPINQDLTPSIAAPFKVGTLPDLDTATNPPIQVIPTALNWSSVDNSLNFDIFSSYKSYFPYANTTDVIVASQAPVDFGIRSTGMKEPYDGNVLPNILN